MDYVMKTFATREQELSNVDTRGETDPKGVSRKSKFNCAAIPGSL